MTPASNVQMTIVYQIANDNIPSGWSDVDKNVYDMWSKTMYRQKRILFVPATNSITPASYTAVNNEWLAETFCAALGIDHDQLDYESSNWAMFIAGIEARELVAPAKGVPAVPYYVVQQPDGTWTIQNRETGAGECIAQQYGGASLEVADFIVAACNAMITPPRNKREDERSRQVVMYRANEVPALIDALRNIAHYRTDVDNNIAARSMRFYAAQALMDFAEAEKFDSSDDEDAAINE